MSQKQKRRRQIRKSSPFHPRRAAFVSCESLEDRTLLAAVTVNNDLDVVNGTTTSIAALIASNGGDGISLREAILAANNTTGADTITFAVGLAGETITLGGTQLTITDAVTITGLGADQLTIDANNLSRIFNVDDGTGAEIDVEISGLTLTGGNIAGFGGAISNRENLSVMNSTISGNSADRGGGLHNLGTLTVANSTLSGNNAQFFSGGIINLGTLTVTNTTISGNSAGIGTGGILNARMLTLTNSTISGNTTPGSGGGLYNYYGTTTLANTIISGNSASTGAEVFNNATLSADANNLFGHSGLTNAEAFTNFTPGVSDNTATSDGTDPTVLAGIINPTLAFNGGTTQTHALDVGSPATNAGNNTHSSGLTNDQRGTPFVRVVGTVDIGAFELQSLALVVDTLVDENDGDYSVGDLSLREAIALANANPEADTITFDASLSGGTIMLGGTELAITDAVTITGLGADRLTISGNNASRIFNINDGSVPEIAVEISGLTLTGGNAGTDSGGAISSLENLTLTNSTLSGNSAVEGGGIFNDGTLTLTNSTLSGNSSTFGGGIYNFFNSTATLTNSTLTGNSAAGNGGGIYNYGSTLTLKNSLITGNSATGDGDEIYQLIGTINANANNLFGHSGITNAQAFYGFTPGASDITATSDGKAPTALASILNTTLADNGGPTLTHALVAGSPAINAGNNTHASGLTTDQRGLPFARLFGGTIDIGAYEVQPRTLIVDTLLDENDGDLSVGDLSLREAILWANANVGVDTITFDASLANGTITLGGTELTITDCVTITGLGADQLTISGNNASRIFNIDEGTGSYINVEIIGLMLTGGNGLAAGGGAIRNFENLTVANSAITGNTTTGAGGGIRHAMGILAIKNSTLSDNNAAYGGGIANYGSATVTNSTISGNQTTAASGGIDNFLGTITVTNSTITDNTTAGAGGGINNFSGTATLVNSLISGNSATGSADEIYNNNVVNANANNLFGHSGLTNAQAFSGFTPGASDITATSDGTNANALSSILNTTLADNGGPTLTHALVTGSPALNAGNNTHASGLTTDQRGTPFTRFNGTVDIGAFEAQSSVVIYGTPEDDIITVSLGATFMVTVNGEVISLGTGIITQLTVDALTGTDTLHLIGTPGVDNTTTNPGTVHLVGPGITFDADSVEMVDIASGGGQDRAFLFDSVGNDTFEAYPTTATLQGDDYSVQIDNYRRVYAYSYAGGTDTVMYYDSAGKDNYVGEANRSWMTGNGYYNSASRFDQVDAYASTGYDSAIWWDSPDDDTYHVEPGLAWLTGPGFNNIAHDFKRHYAYSYNGGFDQAYFYDSPDDDRFVGKEIRSTIQNPDITYYGSATRFDQVHVIADRGGDDRAYFYGTSGNDVFESGVDFSKMWGSTYYYDAQFVEFVIANPGAGGTDTATVTDSAGKDRFVDSAISNQMYWTNGNRSFMEDFKSVDFQSLLGGDDEVEYRNLSILDEVFGQGDLVRVDRNNGKMTEATGMAKVIAQSLAAPGPTLDLTSLDYIFTQTGVWS